MLWKNITEDLCQAKELITQARSFCNAPGGPYLYDEALQSDLILIRAAEEKAAAGDFDGAGELLGKPAFAALSRKKPKDPVDDTLKEQVKSLRENAKDILKDIGTRYFSVKEEELPVLLETCREPVEMLVELTREFIRMYGEKKREKNILDFTDMEHFALEILIQRVHAAEENGENDGNWTGESKYIYHMSPAARELSLKYDEVMVDEYQDSNLVQEMITNCVSGWSETFTEVLSAHGIPVYAASKTGYFSALEVVTILNYLQVCDNPLQDIPLTGVLRSPLVGCTTQELAVLREEHPKGMLYDSVLNFLEEYEGQERTLYHKLHGFIVLLNEMRDLAVYTPVHELILEILRRTGYGNYAKALPNGAQRSANLAMLVEKAMDYEKTSYRGLFNFVRYIEHLQKYEVDYGEVNLSGAGEGSVEIMTIHKSKGLEFPIVILAGMGKQFNMQDLNARLLIHPDYGLGADAILPDRRMIVSTLYKQVIRRKLLEETLGEEIRVLYVALTRAKEKLIMIGTIGNLEKRLLSLYRFRENEQELLPAETRLNGKTYWDYVLPALARHRCMDELFAEFGLLPSHDNLLYDDPAEFQVKRITARTLTEAEVVEQAVGQMEDDILDNWDCEKIVDPEIRAELEKRFGFVYPYEYRKDIPVKVSVSDLKKKSYHEDTDIEEAVYFEPDIVPLVPRFIEEKKETEEAFTGSARGTAYHRVMECLEYNKTDSAQQLKEQINALVQSKKMSEAEAECIRISDIQFFVNGALGQRMKVAALSGLLFREQPFVISRSAAEIDEAWDPKERVLVQGIIDAYFLEGDEIVLVDYKTDRVRRGEEQKLVDLYHTQLEDYAQALHRMTGRRVKEKYIYSFTLKKEILLG